MIRNATLLVALALTLGFPGLSHSADVVAAKALPEKSLYQLSSQWQTDDHRSLKLAELRGKPRLVAMFFSQCESVCPMLVGQLKMLEQNFPDDLKRQFGFVLISFDIARDSAKALADYRAHMGLSPDRWLLLRGNADDTRELAFLLGVDYQPGGKGQIDHNGLIALLDSEGRIVTTVSRIEDRKAFLQTMRSMKANP